MQSLCLKNIKGHFKIPTIPYKYLKTRLEKYPFAKFTNNFCSLKVPNSTLSFIIFTKAKHVNITGVDSLTLFGEAPFLLAQIIRVSYTFFFNTTCIVDNMTFSGSLNKLVNLSNLAKQLTTKKIILRYNPAIFPGLCAKILGKGSILVFISGKYSIVGVKCKQQAQDILTIVKNAVIAN